MTDLVERLRAFPLFYRNGATWIATGGSQDPTCKEAADEIERLRTELAQTRLDLEYRTAEVATLRKRADKA